MYNALKVGCGMKIKIVGIIYQILDIERNKSDTKSYQTHQ